MELIAAFFAGLSLVMAILAASVHGTMLAYKEESRHLSNELHRERRKYEALQTEVEGTIESFRESLER